MRGMIATALMLFLGACATTQPAPLSTPTKTVKPAPAADWKPSPAPNPDIPSSWTITGRIHLAP